MVAAALAETGGTMTISSRIIRGAVAAWLRYERQCHLVVFDRGDDVVPGTPDILAVDKKRMAVEVEIKISMSDFKRDAKKQKWLPHYGKDYYTGQDRRPAFFYYAVPSKLVDKVAPMLPDGVGLLTLEDHVSPHSLTGVPAVVSKVAAQRNKTAPRLSWANCYRMISHQTGTLVTLECEAAANSMEA